MTLLLAQLTRGIILCQPHTGPGGWPSSPTAVPEKQWHKSPVDTQGPARATRQVEECLPRSYNQDLGEEELPTKGKRPGIVSCAYGNNNPLDEDVLLCKSHRGLRVKAAAPTYPWV